MYLSKDLSSEAIISCVRPSAAPVVPYFCAQAAYFVHGTFTTLRPFACI